MGINSVGQVDLADTTKIKNPKIDWSTALPAPPPPKPPLVQPTLGVPELVTAFKNIYPQRFTTPDIDIPISQSIVKEIEANSQEFYSDLQVFGRTPDTETILKSFGATDDEIDQIFPEQLEYQPEGYLKNTWDYISKASVEQFFGIRKTMGIMTLPLSVTPETSPDVWTPDKEVQNLLKIGGYEFGKTPRNTNFTLEEAKALIKETYAAVPQAFPEGFNPNTYDWKAHGTESYSPERIQSIKSNQQTIEKFTANQEELNQQLQDIYARHPDWTPPEGYEEGFTKNPKLLKNPDYWSYMLTSMLPSLVSMFAVATATTAVTGSPALGAVAGAMTFAPSTISSVYDQLFSVGASPEDAANYANMLGGVTTALFATPIGQSLNGLLKSSGKEIIKNTLVKNVTKFAVAELKSGATMGTIGAVQQVMTNAVIQTFDEKRSLFQDVPQSAAHMALVGLAMEMIPALKTSFKGQTPTREQVLAKLKEIEAGEKGGIGGEPSNLSSDVVTGLKKLGMTDEEIKFMSPESAERALKISTRPTTESLEKFMQKETQVPPVKGEVPDLESRIASDNLITSKVKSLIDKMNEIIDKQGDLLKKTDNVPDSEYSKLDKELANLRTEREALEKTRPKIDISELSTRARLPGVEGVSEPSAVQQATQTVPPIKPPEKPPVALTPEPREAPPNIDDIIKKLTTAVQDATPAREVTEQLKHEELSRRVARASAILEKGEGAEAFRASKKALYGALPQDQGYVMDLAKHGITDADITAMKEAVRTSKLRYFQKINTETALDKILSGQIPTEGELLRLQKFFGTDLVRAVLQKLPQSEKVKKLLEEIANIPRTMQTIGDFSAAFRQGGLLSVGQPIQFKDAVVNGMRDMFSEARYKQTDALLRDMPYADLSEVHNMYMAPVEDISRALSREEAMVGARLLEKVPILGKIVRASERAFNSLLNTLRMETWNYWCRKWEGTGKKWADYDWLAKFINHATGRGDLGKLENINSILNATFFSPRYIASRIEVPLDLIKSTPAVRKVIARNLVAFWATGMSALGLAWLAGAEVEIDPRSSDFGKVKVGNNRIDFWAGYLPYIRTITQIAFEDRKRTATGEIIPVNWKDVTEEFIRNKLAPIPGLVWDLKEGETFVGEELTAENADRIVYEKLVPMFIQDLTDAINDSGLSGVGLGMLSAVGIGVQTYEDNWNTEIDKLGLPNEKQEIYTTKTFYSKVSPMIGNATLEMLNKKKNIPDKVLSVAEAKDIKRKLDEVPNEKLYQLEDLEKARYEGDITQTQYVLIKQYQDLVGDKTKDAFLEAHPELEENPRLQQLTGNPKQNAILAIWGQSRIYSAEAYDIAKKMIKDLDIPESAVEGVLPPENIIKSYIEYQDMVAQYGVSSNKAKDVRRKNPEFDKWGQENFDWKPISSGSSNSPTPTTDWNNILQSAFE